jgi:hypothetical protein
MMPRPRTLLATLAIVALLAMIAPARATPVHSDIAFGVDATTLADFEFNSNDLTDSSSAHRDGTDLSDGAVFSTSPFGRALNQSDDRFGSGLSTGIGWSAYVANLGSPYTVEYLLKPAGCSDEAILETNSDGFPSISSSCAALHDNSGHGSEGRVSFGSYHYVVIETDGTATKFYVDGVHTGTSDPTALPFPPTEFKLLHTSWSTPHYNFNGEIDAIRISSGERSASDISDRACSLVAACGAPPVNLPELPTLVLGVAGIAAVALVVAVRRDK